MGRNRSLIALTAAALVSLAASLPCKGDEAIGAGHPATDTPRLGEGHASDWSHLLGDLHIEAKAGGSEFAVSDVVHVDQAATASGHRVYRRVYEIAPGRKPCVSDVTRSLGILERTNAFYTPHAHDAKSDFVLHTWKLKPDAAPGRLCMVTAFAVISFTNGKKAICHFEPVLIADGKVTTPEMKPGKHDKIERE
jgi:hypothetical protein